MARDAELLRCVDTWQAPGVDAGDFEALSKRSASRQGSGCPGRVWASGEPAWIVDVTQDENFPRARAAAEAGIQGAFGFPIRSGPGSSA